MPASQILLGVIGRPHGVRGMVHVTSYADDLAAYGPLGDGNGRRFLLRSRGDGIAEVAELIDGVPMTVADRTAAEKLINVRLYVERARLPDLESEEFYLADLIGLAVFDANGAELGQVSAVHDYGAGASLEIVGQTSTIVPFTRACVPEVNIADQRVTVAIPEAVDA